MSTGHVAAGDCERCRPGVVAQPVNTASSLAFSAAGATILARVGLRPQEEARGEAAVGWAAVLAGLGSVAYHGPGGRLGRYLHDSSLIALLGSLALADLARLRSQPVPRWAVGAPVVVGLIGARPRWSVAAQALTGLTAVAAEAARGRNRDAQVKRSRLGLEVAVAGLGATTQVLGRSGGRWCDPDSKFQPHALWHGAMAATLALRALDVTEGPAR